jgi:glutathione-specific gamma-glutamylcyclotransferase
MNVSREDIVEGRMEALLKEAEDKGIFQRMPVEERDRSRQETMAKLPAGSEIWLFGYGSLMWNPTINYEKRVPARVYGYHRQFCLWTMMGRGTPEQPGLMLALQSGGSCDGFAYRVNRDLAEEELAIVWNREMVSGAYVPRVVTLHTPEGDVPGIAFVINRQHERYAGRLEPAGMIDALAHASGTIGRCCDYLFSTVEHMDELGIGDGAMHDLARRVRHKLAQEQNDR